MKVRVVSGALYPVGVLLHAEAEQVNDERERGGRCAGRVRLLPAGLARVRQHRYELRYVLVIEQLQELVALRLRTCKRDVIENYCADSLGSVVNACKEPCSFLLF